VKIAAPDLDDAMAGAPIRVAREGGVEAAVAAVRRELAELAVETEEEGVVVKADTLGSLEAMADALREAEVPILRAEVGDVAPRDVTIAETANEAVHRTVLGFSVDVLPDAREAAEESEVRPFVDDVIYRLVEEYEAFVEERERAQQETVLEKIVRPARFRLLPDHTFRQSDPAVVGVEVLAGTLQNNRNVARLTDGEPERVGRLSGIQEQGEDVEEARAGSRVSVAIDGPTVGRDVEEGDVLWTELPEKHAKILEQEVVDEITADEREALSGYLDERRSRDPFWGK
jgi:translation initiation factor 5B